MYVNMTYISPISIIQKGDRDGRIEENGQSEKDYDLPGRVDAPGGQVSGLDCENVDGRRYPPDLRGASPESAGTTFAGAQKGGAQMRGDGSVFLRGRIWWIAYYFRGHPYQESSRSTDKKVAQKLLRQR